MQSIQLKKEHKQQDTGTNSTSRSIGTYASSLSKKEQKQLRQLKTGTHTINFAKACGQINTINTIVTEITGINRNTCNQL